MSLADDIRRLVSETVRPLKNMVLLSIGRGIILAVNDAEKIQQLQATLLADEVKDQVESFAHFGFTSNPPADTECIMVSVAGSRDHGVIVATENRALRLKGLASGESAQYNKNQKYIWIKANDNVEMLLAKLKIQNANHEMVAVLSEFMDEVIKGLTITAIGPQPWEPGTKAKLEAVKEKLDTFKT
jgi:phage baseplate assembly protein V